MTDYIILLRGINVGGKNKLSMAELKTRLEAMGYHDVRTYINSGNVLLRSEQDAVTLARDIETMLTSTFRFDSSVIKTLVLTHAQLEAIVNDKPKGFGEDPDTYYSDAIFLIGIDETEAMTVFSPREGVDKIWTGKGVIYSQRLSAERTKSRLNRIIGTPAYQSMTIRSWNTTVKLLQMSSELPQA